MQLAHEEAFSAALVLTYVGDLLARGVMSGVGKDVWDKIKTKTVSVTEKKAAESFEQRPKDPIVVARMEILLEKWIEEDNSYKESLITLLKGISSVTGTNTSVMQSKNTISNSTINISNGDMQVGDRYIK